MHARQLPQVFCVLRRMLCGLPPASPTIMTDRRLASNLHADTLMVHAGNDPVAVQRGLRGALLTQGHVYDTAEECERRFSGDEPGFIYARFSNPTVAMFEARMAALEGAEAARATATGMAAVTASLVGQLRAGDHVVAARALFGSCRYVIEEFLPRFGVASTW
jgi:O-succinylhomoserine sulfhydrylase